MEVIGCCGRDENTPNDHAEPTKVKQLKKKALVLKKTYRNSLLNVFKSVFIIEANFMI